MIYADVVVTEQYRLNITSSLTPLIQSIFLHQLRATRWQVAPKPQVPGVCPDVGVLSNSVHLARIHWLLAHSIIQLIPQFIQINPINRPNIQRHQIFTFLKYLYANRSSTMFAKRVKRILVKKRIPHEGFLTFKHDIGCRRVDEEITILFLSVWEFNGLGSYSWA